MSGPEDEENGFEDDNDFDGMEDYVYDEQDLDERLDYEDGFDEYDDVECDIIREDYTD